MRRSGYSFESRSIPADRDQPKVLMVASMSLAMITYMFFYCYYLSLFVWKHFRHCLRFQMAKRKSLNVLCVGGQGGIHDHILDKVKLG